ncbi:MAG: Uma2 family endonuclease [Candidatus Competibacteraceae bacterium]
MTALKQPEFISITDYLEAERHSPLKHEYVDGHVYAMTGTSKVHNLIVGNLAGVLRNHLRGGPCQVYTSDIKVQAGNRFYYPDVVVACPPSDDPYVETNPLLIIEVLSDSTERIDREEKRLAYQSIATLQEYVLVSQDHREIRLYRRSSEGWIKEQYAAGSRLMLASIALDFLIEYIYEGV